MTTRITKQKKLIYTILTESTEPLSAGAIFEQAQALYPRLAKSTVYRNLESLFANEELVRELQENGEWVYTLPEQHEHKHYMVCKKCNEKWDLPICPIHDLSASIEEQANFTVTDHVVKIYGYCNKCKEEENQDKG